MVNSGLNLTASKVMEAIGRQLDEQIDDELNAYGMSYEYDFLYPFTSTAWMTEVPYINMTFEYEWANFNFLQLCNIVEMMFGVAAENEFFKDLTEQVKCHVQSRIDFHRMQLDTDEQVKLNHELKEDKTA